MFKFFKRKNETKKIIAPISGYISDISSVPDEVFSTGAMGSGIAINTNEKVDRVCAPISGEIIAIFPTGHAFGIRSSNGLEVLVHIGIDTVNAGGHGFNILNIKKGDRVKAGDPIIEVNFDKLKQKYELPVMVIITNTNGYNIIFDKNEEVTTNQKIANIL